MPMETNYMNKANKILILISSIGIILIFLIYPRINIPCIFKKIFHIPCPACGMTRAFKLIFKLKIIKSFSYNILAFPLLLTLIILFIVNIIDIILKKKYINKIINIITKNYYIIIILLLVSWIINIYRNI